VTGGPVLPRGREDERAGLRRQPSIWTLTQPHSLEDKDGPQERLPGLIPDFDPQFAAERTRQNVSRHIGQGRGRLVSRRLDIGKFQPLFIFDEAVAVAAVEIIEGHPA